MRQGEFYELIKRKCESLGFPYSVVGVIMSKIHYVNYIDHDIVYNVKTNTDNKVVAEINDRGKKYTYDIDFSNGQCDMRCDCKTMNPGGLSFDDIVGVIQEQIIVGKSNKSWNNEPGYVILDGQRRSDANVFSKEYSDARYETKRLFDLSGVEMQRVDKIFFYPNEERGKYNGSFLFGFAGPNVFNDGFRRPKDTYVNTARREGIDKAIVWKENFDMMGDRRGESKTAYYHLSNEHGLGAMNFNLGDISKEAYDSLPDKLYGDELEDALGHDYGIVRERLIELYGKSRTL